MPRKSARIARARSVLAAGVILLSTAATATTILSVRREAADPTWVQGAVAIRAAPEVIWTRLGAVDSWTTLFSDVTGLKVKEHQGGHWRVRLDSAIFKCGPHDYHLSFEPNRTLRLRIDAPGLDAYGTILIEAGAGGASTVTYRLRVKVGRVASWFASESDVRQRQEQLVQRYLGDLAKAFGD